MKEELILIFLLILKMLTGQRDTDLLILSNLNDEDLLNFCLVNKEANRLCQIESFWLNRFIKEHGQEAMKYKSHEKTWRKFYLQIVYYWNNAEDNWRGKFNNAMKNAARGGHQDLVNFFISKGAHNWNLGMNGAARGGHQDLVDFFISKGADAWNYGMSGAARGGHQDLVDFFKQKMKDK